MGGHRDKAIRRVRSVRQRGYGLYLVTLTIQSLPLGQLTDQINTLLHLLAGARSGSPYERLRDACGIAGTLRVLHITITPEGWHGHLHLVVAAKDRESTKKAAEWLCARLLERMARAGLRVTFRAVDARHAQTPERLAGYLLRPWRPGDPASPFGLMTLAAQGDERARRVYEELSMALKGRPYMRCSGVFLEEDEE
jgi:hypothetical protein